MKKCGETTMLTLRSKQVYLVLIKLSFFFMFSFIIIYAFVNVHYEQPEFSLALAVIPIGLIQVGLAVYYTRMEAKIGMCVTIVSHPFYPSNKKERKKAWADSRATSQIIRSSTSAQSPTSSPA